MNESLIIGGILLIGAGIFFSVITFGLGAICTGPMILLGIILFIVGLIFPVDVKTVHPVSSSPSRFCTHCGRAIPFDAKICPYCGKNFEQK